MFEGFDEKIKEIRRAQERVDYKLASMLVPVPDQNTFGLDTTDGHPPVFVKHLLKHDDVQVLLCTIPAGLSIKEHAHSNSVETVTVVSGILGLGDEKYMPGESITLPAGAPHAPAALGDVDCTTVTVVVPPEVLYEQGRLSE